MQARLRAQLGDRSKYSGKRRRRSVVVASIVLTITDPLRGSCPLLYYLQAALIRSCGASFACMELTIISRFQRPQDSTKSLLHSLFYSFSVLSPKACPYVWAKSFFGTHSGGDERRWGHKKALGLGSQGLRLMIAIESVYFITFAEEVVPSV